MQLEGKTALVICAGGGIGRATAIELAKTGAAIAVNDLDQRAVEETRAEVESLGRQVMSAQTDIGDLASIDAMVNKVVGEFGHIDIVVNNVGVTRHGALLDITVETWDLMQRINAKGTFFCMQGVAKQMVEHGRLDDPEDIAAMAVFLAGPGGRNITGQTINVDGGLVMN